MVFSTSNTERMRITSGGDVGIGTTSPDSMLHLKSTGDVKLILEADSDNSGENDNPLIELKQDNSGIIGRLGMVGDAGQLFTNSRANSTGVVTVIKYLRSKIIGSLPSPCNVKFMRWSSCSNTNPTLITIFTFNVYSGRVFCKKYKVLLINST